MFSFCVLVFKDAFLRVLFRFFFWRPLFLEGLLVWYGLFQFSFVFSLRCSPLYFRVICFPRLLGKDTIFFPGKVCGLLTNSMSEKSVFFARLKKCFIFCPGTDSNGLTDANFEAAKKKTAPDKKKLFYWLTQFFSKTVPKSIFARERKKNDSFALGVLFFCFEFSPLFIPRALFCSSLFLPFFLSALDSIQGIVRIFWNLVGEVFWLGLVLGSASGS